MEGGRCLPRALIASRISTEPPGGLAGYQNRLAAELESHSIARATFFCPDKDPTPGIWMRLASRPWAHALLEKLIVRHYKSAIGRLRSQQYDVVHFVGTGWDFLGFAMCALARGTGSRFTIWPAVHPGQWGDDRIDLRLYRKADAVMCQSDNEAGLLVKLGLDPGKIIKCTLPPMCRRDGDGRRLRTKLGMGDRPAVLFLGRRDRGKGYPALLQAWRKVLERHPKAVLLLAGPTREDFSDELRALDGDSIRDLQVPDEQTKADALAACDIFCLPSAHESFGIVFVEAWSYGRPVICGPAPACREWIREGQTGLWAEQTPDSIARSIVQLLDDPEGTRQMGSAGRQFQQTHLTAENFLLTHQNAFGLTKPH